MPLDDRPSSAAAIATTVFTAPTVTLKMALDMISFTRSAKVTEKSASLARGKVTCAVGRRWTRIGSGGRLPRPLSAAEHGMRQQHGGPAPATAARDRAAALVRVPDAGLGRGRPAHRLARRGPALRRRDVALREGGEAALGPPRGGARASARRRGDVDGRSRAHRRARLPAGRARAGGAAHGQRAGGRGGGRLV